MCCLKQATWFNSWKYLFSGKAAEFIASYNSRSEFARLKDLHSHDLGSGKVNQRYILQNVE